MGGNKAGKYLKYAAGEIILVVIGILIALQINNWNDIRKNQRKEKTILSAIHNEFTINKTQLDSVAFYHKLALKGCDNLISMFPIDIEKNNLDTIAKHLENITQSWTFNPSQSSIVGLINSSSIDIIRNDELRKLLMSWQDLLLDYQEDELISRTVIYTNFDELMIGKLDFNFNFKDHRYDLSILESLELEYLLYLRRGTLENILNDGQYETLEFCLDRIIELTKPDKQK
ncbi:MAG: hypothetical protein COA49_04055 [Bacteroidetes bacterium]|nr:MAG: hypothetical protein COA49_04055 [Bacteroidota bacterium]